MCESEQTPLRERRRVRVAYSQSSSRQESMGEQEKGTWNTKHDASKVVDESKCEGIMQRQQESKFLVSKQQQAQARANTTPESHRVVSKERQTAQTATAHERNQETDGDFKERAIKTGNQNERVCEKTL